MTALLRAAWLAADTGGGERVAAYAAEVARHATGPTAAYLLQPKTPVMADITGRLEHMDEQRYRVLPTHLVLAEVDHLDAGLQLEADVRDATSDAGVVVAGLYSEVVTVTGSLGAPDGLAPAIQLGTFAMRSAADEWAVSEWYRTRRLPSFSRIPGGHRARRFVSVCGGPAKLAVLYEFRSLEDRAAHFEALETVDHDAGRPTAAARTVHPPMSPSVGALLPS